MHSIALVALLVVAPASASAPASAPASQGDADAQARANAPQIAGTTRYDFDNDNVSGELLSPEGIDVPARHLARFPSLIKVRGVFVPEMIHLANDV